MIALERLRDLGALIGSTEMIAYELMRSAQHPQFKKILTFIK
jgi:hypothetical protein